MWQEGMKAFCLNSAGWWQHDPVADDLAGPKYGDIVTVSWSGPDPEEGYPSLCFYEWGSESYHDTQFRPLDSLEQQMDEIEESFVEEPEYA